MSVQTADLRRQNSESLTATPAVLEKLASRVRGEGACLVLLAPDASVQYVDRVAGAFFARYAVPVVTQNAVLAEKIRRLPPGTPAIAFDSLPGILVAAIPVLERRQVQAVIALVSRAPVFRLSEDVLHACQRLEIDSTWLGVQADAAPAWTREALCRQTTMLCAMLRDQIALAGMQTELTNLSEQLANTYEELSLIYQISGGMRVNRRAADFFKQACNDVMDVMNVRGVGVALQGEGASQLDPVIYGETNISPDILRRLTDQLIPLLKVRKSLILVNDLAGDEQFSWLSSHAQRILAVPLQRQEQVLGCMFVVDKQSGEFDSVDSKLLNSIGNESAIYIENSVLFSDAHGLMMGLMHSLTSAVDAKDPYTCGHSERVALLSRHMAQQIGLPDSEVDQIYMAGLLHDVGKIGVPESVLQKTGRLSPEEFEQMKKHPQIGARILADVKQIRAIIPGVLHHHERYDGKGYPSALSGTNIPLMGRIICLADCFDAMTSNRTYRRALPLEVAITEIRRCAGTQFDPALAEAFVKTGPDHLRELLRNHAEKSKRVLALQESLLNA